MKLPGSPGVSPPGPLSDLGPPARGEFGPEGHLGPGATPGRLQDLGRPGPPRGPISRQDWGGGDFPRELFTPIGGALSEACFE